MTKRHSTLADDDRGQTLQDYLLGISVFVVVVFVALGFFPNFLDGLQTDSMGGQEAQADRIGREIVSEYALNGTVNELDAARMESLSTKSEDDLREKFGLSNTTNINITVETLNSSAFVDDGSNTLNSVPDYYDRQAGSAARIVTLSDPSYDCSPACRLVVRVW